MRITADAPMPDGAGGLRPLRSPAHAHHRRRESTSSSTMTRASWWLSPSPTRPGSRFSTCLLPSNLHYIYTCIHACMHTCIYVCHICTCMYIHVIYTWFNIYVIYVYTYTHKVYDRRKESWLRVEAACVAGKEVIVFGGQALEVHIL